MVEHRIARLVQLGIRKSRFFGREKTRFQLLMAAAVANLTLVWNAAAKRAKQGASSSLLSWLSAVLAWLLGTPWPLRGSLPSRPAPMPGPGPTALAAA